MNRRIPISIWINEQRFEKLKEAGLSGLTGDLLGGMKVIRVQVNETQKDWLLSKIHTAKYDSSTTGPFNCSQGGQGRDIRFLPEKQVHEGRCHRLVNVSWT